MAVRIGLMLVALCVGCADTGGQAVLATQRYQTFQQEVYPVLLRDCAFPACHGDQGRFLRILGPGRVRLTGETLMPDALEQATLDEVALCHSLALSMIDPVDWRASPLLRKPLAVAAGGSGHQGVDAYDRDVYRTTQDQGYRTIERWVKSVEAERAAQAAMPQP